MTYEELETEYRDACKQLDGLYKEIDKLEAEVSQLRNGKIEALQQRVKDLEYGNYKLERRIAGLNEQIGIASERLVELKDENERIRVEKVEGWHDGQIYHKITVALRSRVEAHISKQPRQSSFYSWL